MRLVFCSKVRAFDGAAVALSGAAYSKALLSTAIAGFWYGPDFENPPMTGLSCLLSGWLYSPVGWMANPVLVAGAFFLLARHRLAACITAALALGLAGLWANTFRQSYQTDLLREGYDWWLVSMCILAIGSFCSLVVQFNVLQTHPAGRRADAS